MGDILYAGLASVMEKEKQPSNCPGRMTYKGHTVTMEFDETSIRLIMPVDVCECAEGAVKYRLNAVWDTGSTSSAISEKFARKMHLAKTGNGIACTASGQIEIYFSYLDLYLSPELVLRNLKVGQYPLVKHDVDFLIGMDVISKGDFKIINANGKTEMEYSINEADTAGGQTDADL